MLVETLYYFIIFNIIEFGLYYTILKNYKKPSLLHALPQSLLVMIISVTIMRWLPIFDMEKATGFIPIVHTKKAISLVILCAICWCVLLFLIKKYVLLAKKTNHYPLWVKIIMFILMSLSIIIVFFSTWFRNFFGQLTPEQFLFNLQSPVVGTAGSMSMEIILTPVFLSVFFIIIFVYIIFGTYSISLKKLQKGISYKISLIGVVLLFIGSSTYTVVLLRLDSVVRTYLSQSMYIENNYVDIRNTHPIFPQQKRNLIHIYMESVENSYFDKTLGGYMTDNLMPDLAQLATEGVQFSHTDKMGGPHQTYGSSWSVASMINMMSGIPLKVAMDGNSYGKSGYFLPGIYNLGDLLHDNGYEQTVMFGADADFGGLTTYFTSHGKFNIFDVKYARQQKLIPQDYNVWWGFEDDKLYEYAKMELTRLSKSNKPFHLTMENADTHFPNGYITERTPRLYDKQYANVIAHSQKQVVALVRWIQQQPFYNNTTIVITGDHLSMDKDFFADFNPEFERTVFNLILNAPVTASKTKNRQFSPVDMYPTILASIGITFDGNRAGIGTNLFSNLPTLIEKDGLDKFNSELEKNSNFYNSQFVNEKKARK